MSSPVALERIVAALGDIRLDSSGTVCHLSGKEFTGRHRSDLEHQLARVVYRLLHSGEPVEEENRVDLRTPWLEEELIAALPHRYSAVPAQVLEVGETGAVVVVEGLRLLIDADDIVPEEAAETGAARVWLRSARPALSPGFVLTDGSRGGLGGDRVVRCYVHLVDPYEAGDVWAVVTGFLEDAGAHYRAKVLSCVSLYPRRDGMVVYLDSSEVNLLIPLAQRVTGMKGVGGHTSLFAHELAPGVAVASEPTVARSSGRPLSFGQHRARAVAAGIVDSKDGAVLETITAALRSADIDPARPHVGLGENFVLDHWTRQPNTI